MPPGPQTCAPRTRLRVLPASWLVVLLLLGASSALAQAPARTVPVIGTILDPSGAPAAGVTVSLKNGIDTVLLSVETDISGRFRFDAVAPGSYFVAAEGQGFSPS